MRCLIVDDEAPARMELRRLLAAHAEVDIVGEASDVTTALDLTAQLRPDVVFLDVKLRGETGFDYVGRAPEPLPHLIFVTAYNRFAIRGFECNALDYLLKPVRPERLVETLARLQRQRPLHHPAQSDDVVFLKTSSTARFIPWRDVHHIVAEGNYTTLFLEDRSSVSLIRSLKQWIDLAPVELFIQVHRTALVRINAIRRIESSGEGQREMFLSDGSRLPVGRAYWAKIKALGTSG